MEADIAEKLEEIQQYVDERDWATALQANQELRTMLEKAQEEGSN